MSDDTEARIKAFVMELVADTPLPPPFPHAVVIEADEPETREAMTQQQQDRHDTRIRVKDSALRIALAAFVVTVLVAGAALIVGTNSNDSNPGTPGDDTPTIQDDMSSAIPSGPALDPADGASVLTDVEAKVVGGGGTVPDLIIFQDNGIYRVIDGFETVHSGLYSVDGDVVTFDVRPDEDDVLWVQNDVELRNVQHCREMPGTYTVVFGTGSTVSLNVISDPCVTRITAANGLKLEIRES